MGQFNHYSSQEWVCSCPLHHDTSKAIFAIIVKLLIIWYFPKEQHWGLAAMLPVPALPLHPTPPQQPCGTPGLSRARAGSLLSTEQQHQRCQQQPRGLSRAQHSSCSCSCLRNTALGAPNTSLLRKPRWAGGAAAEWNCILHSKCWGLRTGPSRATGTAPLLVDMVWLNFPSCFSPSPRPLPEYKSKNSFRKDGAM